MTIIKPELCADCVTAEMVMMRLGCSDKVRWAKYDDSPNALLHASDSQAVKPPMYCTRFQNELRWFRSFDTGATIIYVAHPVKANDTHSFEDNIASARRWLFWLKSLNLEGLKRIGIEGIGLPTINAPWRAPRTRIPTTISDVTRCVVALLPRLDTMRCGPCAVYRKAYELK